MDGVNPTDTVRESARTLSSKHLQPRDVADLHCPSERDALAGHGGGYGLVQPLVCRGLPGNTKVARSLLGRVVLVPVAQASWSGPGAASGPAAPLLPTSKWHGSSAAAAPGGWLLA